MVYDGLSYVSNPLFLSPDPGTCLNIFFKEIIAPHVGSYLSVAIRTVCTQSELRKFGKFNLCAESVEHFYTQEGTFTLANTRGPWQLCLLALQSEPLKEPSVGLG